MSLHQVVAHRADALEQGRRPREMAGAGWLLVLFLYLYVQANLRSAALQVNQAASRHEFNLGDVLPFAGFLGRDTRPQSLGRASFGHRHQSARPLHRMNATRGDRGIATASEAGRQAL
ncbi:MAG: hypothetical protein ABSH24_27785 [Bryobacteraceae bacterium]